MNTTNTAAAMNAAAVLSRPSVKPSDVKPSAAAVRFYSAEMRNASIICMRNGLSIYAAAESAAVSEYAALAAVACKLLTAEQVEKMDAAALAALAADILPAFVSVSIKGSSDDIRRIYRVKGVSAAVRAVKSARATSECIGDIIAVTAPATKKPGERKPHTSTPADRLARAEWNLAKAQAEVKHNAADGEFKFPTFAEWKKARAEVVADKE